MEDPKRAKTARKTPKTPKNPSKTTDIGANQAKKVKNDWQRASYHALSPADRSLRMWRQIARPPTPRAGSTRSKVSRNVALANAFCSFSDIEEVVRIYTACALINELGWDVYVVDHIVPLLGGGLSGDGNGILVCGLHTHTNLQVITARENHAKGHHLWPGMWPITYETLEMLMAAGLPARRPAPSMVRIQTRAPEGATPHVHASADPGPAAPARPQPEQPKRRR